MVELAFILLATVVSWPPALTKKCCMSEPFPTGLPRADKITPKSVRTLHEGSREKVSKYFTALYLLYSISCLQLRTLAGRHVVGVFVVEDLGSFILFFAHALSFNRLLIASLAPLIAVVEVSFFFGCAQSRSWQICASSLECKNNWVCSTARGQNWSPANLFWRASFGVCGLLALPNIHQIFGDNSAKFPQLAACRGVSFLLLKAICSERVYDGNIDHGSLRTSLWGTQWGQLNRSFALSLLSALIERRSGSLRRLLAWYNSLPSGGLPQGCGSSA